MRKLIAALAATLQVAGTSSSAADPKPPFTVESGVFETVGVAKDIAQRARVCVVQHVRYDSTRLSDATGAPSQAASGGNLFVTDDPESGIVAANNRVPFRMMLSQWSAQSVVTILAKDGRFKIQHTNVQAAMLSTGYTRNDGYRRVGEQVRGEKEVAKVLTELSAKLAECIQANQADW